MKQEDEIIAFYGKYNEEKRLLTPYGRVEYLVTKHFLDEEIAGRTGLTILDIGAGTGRYAIPLAEEGHDVTAVDLTPYNSGITRQKAGRKKITNLLVRTENALALKKEAGDAFDLVLLFGPMYHLFREADKIQALKEAKRVLKPGGRLFVSYIMNDFAVVKFGFTEGHAMSSRKEGKLDESFHVRNEKEDLFSYDRVEDMDRYNDLAGLVRLRRIAQDGPTNYIRGTVTEMDEDTFALYLQYVTDSAERPELIGASCHVMDVLTK